VETYCPATDGHSAAQTGEEAAVGRNGVEIRTGFPAWGLRITNSY
jgi:hypothetical protein